MKKSSCLLTLAALGALCQSASAQNEFVSGYYQITSGRYTECCGFAGPFIYSLPDEQQAFVELTVAPDRNTVRMTFLGPDLATVFTSYPWVHDQIFTFSFSNGVVHADHLQFGNGIPVPTPRVSSWNYIVSNSADGLSIQGEASIPPFGADVPNHFEHTKVVATLVRTVTVIDRVERAGDALRFHFTGQPPYDYTVEFTDSLRSPNWLPLASYRAKIQPIDVVVTHSFTNAQTRYFRVRQVPCLCR